MTLRLRAKARAFRRHLTGLEASPDAVVSPQI
jgi:hypothetical protein